MICCTSRLLLAVAALVSVVKAHRSLPSGVTCNSQFFSPESALVIPNTKISWASYRIFTCDEPIFWLEADAEQDQNLQFTVTVPVIDRFEDVRISVALIGAGLPALTDEVNVPDEVRQYSLETGSGVSIFQSPQDQSDCNHLTAEPMIKETEIVDERCHFYERFGGSNSWVVLDEAILAPQDGVYKIAVFVEGGTTAKATFACCDWPEDFVTNYPIPESDCPFCGTSPEDNPAWLSYFYEQESMEEYGGFPPAQSCSDGVAQDVEPTQDQCPPVVDPDQGFDSQPASCTLGCGSDGECHSHNVFGECTHLLDWTLQPMFGDAPVSKVIIFKGDKITFSSNVKVTSAHNLFQMVDDTCDFTGATALADVEEVAIGHTVSFDEAGTFYFSCGISCTGFPGDENTFGMVREEDTFEYDALECHCAMGQKLEVEVKDSSEGLRCHDHLPVTNEGAAGTLTCADGEVAVRAIGNSDYGAIDETKCAEFCIQSFVVQFLDGVEMGTCADKGFTNNPVMVSMTPPNSPVEVEVRIVSNTEGSTCHCHSYEQIACPEDEAPDDMLYDEHIQELEQYCTGVINGDESACPYKCFQPFEVLHLHYLECKSRQVDPTYQSVNATKKCHIATTAPAGSDCQDVNLGESNDTSGAEQPSSILDFFRAFWSWLISLFHKG